MLAGTPIPSQRVVHDHGVVEIMRGCPQGCRFCSAGVYYRPYRMKNREVIDTEVSYLVDVLGYREITLSSLSSGDSRDIFGLFRFLNEKYGMRAIRSSTKVKMNVTVSTFVPKPHTPFQWARQLPPSEADDQLRRTKELLKRLGIKMGYPDPFTSALEGVLSRGDARVGELILSAARRGCYLDPWDEHFKKAAWQAALDEAGWDVFGETLGERDPDAPLPWDDVSVGVAPSILKREYRRSLEGKLTEHCAPDCREPCGICNRNTQPRVLSESPKDPVPEAEPPARPVDRIVQQPVEGSAEDKPTGTLLLAFRKTGPAAYLAHLSTMALFERAFQRGKVPVAFTEGFNPKPRLQFAQPLSVGISSEQELALVLLAGAQTEATLAEEIVDAINAGLPEGFEVTEAALYPAPSLRLSLMSLYWGGDFRISGHTETLARLEGFLEGENPDWASWWKSEGPGSESPEELSLRFSQDRAGDRGLKKTLMAILDEDYKQLRIHRLTSLARDAEGQPVDYFSALAASQSFSS